MGLDTRLPTAVPGDAYTRFQQEAAPRLQDAGYHPESIKVFQTYLQAQMGDLVSSELSPAVTAAVQGKTQVPGLLAALGVTGGVTETTPRGNEVAGISGGPLSRA